MKRLFIASQYYLLNLDFIGDISVERETLNVQSDHFTERHELMDSYVVQADRVVLYKSAIEEKCNEFMTRLSHSICRSDDTSTIIVTSKSTIVFPMDGTFRTIPDEKYKKISALLRTLPTSIPWIQIQ